MYALWIKINETLPWIELEGTYETRKEAKETAERLLKSLEVKVVAIPAKRKQVKTLAAIETTC